MSPETQNSIYLVQTEVNRCVSIRLCTNMIYHTMYCIAISHKYHIMHYSPWLYHICIKNSFIVFCDADAATLRRVSSMMAWHW